VNGVSVQIGPRRAGRCCAAWGLAVARDRFITVLVIVTVAVNLAVVMVMLNVAARDSVPAVYTPAPTVFCPSGQHVTGVSASGWPDCAPDH
jgi:hypothetical protein